MDKQLYNLKTQLLECNDLGLKLHLIETIHDLEDELKINLSKHTIILNNSVYNVD